MKLKDLKQKIAEIESAFGSDALELTVYITEPHEYWGDIQTDLRSMTVVASVWTGNPKDSDKRAIVIE